MEEGVTFRGLRGHERTAEVLCRAVASDRLHHASLFTGPSGVGKRAAALALASLLNCSSRVEQGGLPDACGVCRHCRRVASGQHPDVIRMEPQGRNIRIEQVRELAGVMRYRPVEGRVRVVLVLGAETMRVEAANALLKTLEEPTGETVFVLLTDQPHLLLSTIRSRCQPVRFGRLPVELVEELLVARGLSAAEAEVLAKLSDGSPGRALELHGSPLLEEREAFFATLAQVPEMDLADRLRQAEELAGRKDQLEPLLQLAQSLYRDAAVLRATGDGARCVNRDSMVHVEALARRRETAQLHRDAVRVRETLRLLEGNVNARLAMEALLLDLGSRSPESTASA